MLIGPTWHKRQRTGHASCTAEEQFAEENTENILKASRHWTRREADSAALQFVDAGAFSRDSVTDADQGLEPAQLCKAGQSGNCHAGPGLDRGQRLARAPNS